MNALASNAGVTVTRDAWRVESRRAIESPLGRDFMLTFTPSVVLMEIPPEVVDWINSNAAIAITESESRLEIEIELPLLARMKSVGNVEAEDAVEQRLPVANSAHRAANVLQMVPIANPAEIAEER